MRRLLIRPGAIGDLIVSLAALEFLRADYTEVWVPGQNVPLIRFADRVRSLASTRIDLVELGLESPAIFDGFDEIVSWYGSNRQEFRDAVNGLPFRFLTALPSAGRHATDFYLAQVGATPGAVTRIPATRWDGGFVAVHPYSGSPAKNWPLANFQELARRIPMEWCHERFDDLYRLAEWLAGARMFIGNDSGITHLAAAVGTPVIALFGPTDPAIWAPRGATIVSIDSTVEQVERIVLDCLR